MGGEGELTPFKGCLVSSTGLPLERRTEVARLLLAMGGKFTPDLMREYSDKFKVAKTAWGHIKCVNEEWFWSSVSQNVCLDESLYPVSGASATILEKSRSGDGQNQSGGAVSGAAAAGSVLSEEKDFYLEGCRIYITGFDSVETKRLVNMVLKGGGTRYVAFHDRITHLILGNPSPSELKDIRQEAIWGAIHVVLPTWLEECTLQRQEVAVTSLFAVPQNLLSRDFYVQPGKHRTAPVRETSVDDCTKRSKLTN